MTWNLPFAHPKILKYWSETNQFIICHALETPRQHYVESMSNDDVIGCLQLHLRWVGEVAGGRSGMPQGEIQRDLCVHGRLPVECIKGSSVFNGPLRIRCGASRFLLWEARLEMPNSEYLGRLCRILCLDWNTCPWRWLLRLGRVSWWKNGILFLKVSVLSSKFRANRLTFFPFPKSAFSFFEQEMGVSKKYGYPKMDGENNGKPY